MSVFARRHRPFLQMEDRHVSSGIMWLDALAAAGVLAALGTVLFVALTHRAR
jgi:hypothetical protein